MASNMEADGATSPELRDSVPHHGSKLTGSHVQSDTHLREEQQQEEATNQDSPLSPQLSPLPRHPFDFSFPTLNIDGSTDELTAHQTRRYRTPPAALSALGAKARMAPDPDTSSESGSSQTNDQWELIDNLSEISNDDHDTASITSNDRTSEDGELTPDHANSEDELDGQDDTPDENVVEEVPPEQALNLPTPTSTTASFVEVSREPSQSPRPSLTSSRLRQVRAENDLIDSYMSENQETPTQSTIQSAATFRRSTAFKTLDLDDQTKRILFISDRRVAQDAVDLMCSRIAPCMSQADADAASKHRVVRLPLTPAGITPPSATVVYGEDRVSATVQHCIGADRRSFGSHGLRILDVDGEHSSIFTIGGDGKIDLPKPDIAVIYLDGEADDRHSWIWSACDAVRSIQVPIAVIYEPKHDPRGLTGHIKAMKPKPKERGGDRQLLIDAKDFINTDYATLTQQIQSLLTPVQPSEGKKKASYRKPLQWIQLLLLFIGSGILLSLFGPNPAVQLPARRAALSFSLQQATNSPNITSDLNLQHLLPEIPARCYQDWSSSFYNLLTGTSATQAECAMMPHFQALRPNHFVLSLPGQRSYPEPTSTVVHKADGRHLDFNQTKLINGIYLVTFDPDQACGSVTVNMATKNPAMNVTAPHHFGRCIYKRYEAASTDVSKAMSKDVAVMRGKAKHLGDKLSTELGAGMWATKNVTSQVAQYVSRELQVLNRELQVISNTAASIFGKAAKASNYTATTLTKDLMVMQKDLVKFTKGISSSVKGKVELAKSSSKSLIASQLSLSRERIQDFKKACQRKRAGKPATKPSLEKRLDTWAEKNIGIYADFKADIKAAQSIGRERDVEKLSKTLREYREGIEKEKTEKVKRAYNVRGNR
ncbi:hypothetical protein HII31_04198 [Pseudocercospora fuligena]|uniref:Uncharacterized protein n=1 Tax=Pseudocercospora fuligena TaxID=685502 RepID=A0A8H6RP71_9PEZI|nr:hypothetical protein HII31_04198 [Pseudocercospora fuligena]